MEYNRNVAEKAKFSNNDDDELIELVSSYEILWRLTHPEHKSSRKKDATWQDIGVSLNKSGEHCKSRWRTIRDNFKRHRKIEESGTGQPCKKKRATYWDSLRFLNVVEDERQGFSNTEELDSPADPVQDIVEVSLVDESGAEAIREDNSPCNHVIQTTNHKEDTRGVIMKGIEKLIASEDTVEDDIDIFLKSIGSTMKQFTAAEKAEAKRNIFNVLTTLSKLLSLDKTPSLRSLTVLPLMLSPERDEDLLRLTENRVPAFTHDLVPDYLRTKPEPEVEQKMVQIELKASNLSYEAAQKQVAAYSKVVTHIYEIVSKAREEWESDSAGRAGAVQTCSVADTQSLVAAVGLGKGLKPLAGAPPGMMNPVGPGRAPGQQPQPPPMGPMGKAPGVIKTNIKQGGAMHPYAR